MSEQQLLTYEQVAKEFGWKSHKPIRIAVKDGRLTRVFLSKSLKSARITADSVAALKAGREEVKETLKEFGIKGGQWAAWREAKKHEQETAEQAKAVDQSQVVKTVYVNEFGDQFAPNPEGSIDPISGQHTPPGCYRDETDTLIYGLPSPRESQRIFVARCKLRGIRPANSLYTACIMDGAGHYRVNDVPEKQRSRPALQFTPPIGTLGH
jgi:hypothetical protein